MVTNETTSAQVKVPDHTNYHRQVVCCPKVSDNKHAEKKKETMGSLRLDLLLYLANFLSYIQSVLS